MHVLGVYLLECADSSSSYSGSPKGNTNDKAQTARQPAEGPRCSVPTSTEGHQGILGLQINRYRVLGFGIHREHQSRSNPEALCCWLNVKGY